MVKPNGLLRVFWPLESVQPGVSGVLVGFRNSETDILVVSILEDAEVRTVENALKVGTLFRNSPHPIDKILERCGRPQLQAIGVVNPKGSAAYCAGADIVAYYDKTTRYPRVHFQPDASLSCQVILFARPDPTRMQYMSLDPMTLSLADRFERESLAQLPLDEIETADRLEKQRVRHLVEKLKQHTVEKYPPTRKDHALPVVIGQINCCWELNALLHQNLGLVRSRAKRTLSVSERVVESATDLWDYTLLGLAYLWTEVIRPVLLKAFIHGLIMHRCVGEVILVVAEWRPVALDAALTDVSATAQQVDLRLQQFCYWPVQYMTLRKRKDNWESITNNHTEYIRYYNSLWLVANDVIMGIAIGSYIIENADGVAHQVSSLIEAWSVTGLQRIISWLMDYPAGLKLNTELARFLGDLFLWVVDYWAGCVGALRPTFPHLVRFIGFASFAGASMPLALCSDLLSLFTLHIHCFYVASARIYGWQLTIIVSLFHLFRGKKRNVLRKRIDSCDYELDQLLLGTILFTLLTFLLPTVAVFYFTCAMARSIIILVKALLDTQLAALNHFPLFALMLRIKDSGRLPGGILFELHDSPPIDSTADSAASPNSSYITMKSTPLPLSSIFHEYWKFGGRIRRHYLSRRVFVGFVSGAFVPPLHRKNLYALQYSMLPARRVPIPQLWASLKAAAAAAAAVTPAKGVRSAAKSTGHHLGRPLPPPGAAPRKGIANGFARRSHY